MMKENDLMIGDWVLVNGNPMQIQAIDDIDGEIMAGDELYCLIEDRVHSEDKIEPIPLTAEILEKNGFYKQKWSDLVTEYSYVTDLDKSPQTVIQYTIYSKEIEGVKSLCEIWTKSQYGNGQNDCHICGLYYVHELQHALRLCGIDKTIEL